MFLTDILSSFPEGSQVVTREKIGRRHGSEEQLFWVPFYIILVKKSQHRVFSRMGHAVHSQDHAVRFINSGVKVQPIGKWCNWGCGRALHLPVAYCSLKGMSSPWAGAVTTQGIGLEPPAPEEKEYLHPMLKDWAINLSRCLQVSALRVNLTLASSLSSSLKGKTLMSYIRTLKETKLRFSESIAATVWQLN